MHDHLVGIKHKRHKVLRLYMTHHPTVKKSKNVKILPLLTATSYILVLLALNAILMKALCKVATLLKGDSNIGVFL